MGEVMRLEVVPDNFDVVELWGIFWQPFDGKPVRLRHEGREREFTDVDRPLSSTSTTGLAGLPGLGPYRSSSCSRWATKSVLRLVALV